MANPDPSNALSLHAKATGCLANGGVWVRGWVGGAKDLHNGLVLDSFAKSSNSGGTIILHSTARDEYN